MNITGTYASMLEGFNFVMCATHREILTYDTKNMPFYIQDNQLKILHAHRGYHVWNLVITENNDVIAIQTTNNTLREFEEND